MDTYLLKQGEAATAGDEEACGCVICHEGLGGGGSCGCGNKGCSARFHPKCLNRWIRGPPPHNTCPCCRQPSRGVPEEETPLLQVQLNASVEVRGCPGCRTCAGCCETVGLILVLLFECACFFGFGVLFVLNITSRTSAIELCPSVLLQSNTTVTLNTTAMCNPEADYERWIDILKNYHIGPPSDLQPAVVCDPAFQRRDDSYWNDTCTLVNIILANDDLAIPTITLRAPLLTTPNGFGGYMNSHVFQQRKIDALKWNSHEVAEAIFEDMGWIGLCGCLFILVVAFCFNAIHWLRRVCWGVSA